MINSLLDCEIDILMWIVTLFYLNLFLLLNILIYLIIFFLCLSTLVSGQVSMVEIEISTGGFFSFDLTQSTGVILQLGSWGDCDKNSKWPS